MESVGYDASNSVLKQFFRSNLCSSVYEISGFVVSCRCLSAGCWISKMEMTISAWWTIKLSKWQWPELDMPVNTLVVCLSAGPRRPSAHRMVCNSRQPAMNLNLHLSCLSPVFQSWRPLHPHLQTMGWSGSQLILHHHNLAVWSHKVTHWQSLLPTRPPQSFGKMNRRSDL